MQQKRALWIAASVALALVVACASDKSKTNPASPSGSLQAADGTNAAADGSTLKVSAPTPVSPVGGVRVTERRPRISWSAASGKYVGGTFNYRLQIVNDASTVVEEVAGGGLFHTMTTDLAIDKAYRWRVRAEFDGAAGPWSSYASFLSPQIPEGYIKSNEIFDPLTAGKTVGTVYGPVEWITGKGVKLLTHDSHITYQLPATLEAGEFSLMVTGMDEGSPGDKTKVMSMQEGFGDITTNDYRCTIEKRGAAYTTPGAVTFRIIDGNSSEEDSIHDGTRIAVSFSDENWYFWKFLWGPASAELKVQRDSTTGGIIYQRGVGLGHAYRPVPHVLHLGAPVGRAGAQDATVPGMVIKNVWVSPNPRPSWVDLSY